MTAEPKDCSLCLMRGSSPFSALKIEGGRAEREGGKRGRGEGWREGGGREGGREGREGGREERDRCMLLKVKFTLWVNKH